jgi:hypothetical protein
MKRLLIGLSTGWLLAAAPCHAVTIDLTSNYCGCGNPYPSFGTVTVIQDGLGVDLTAHLAAGYGFVGYNAPYTLKFNTADVALADITVDDPTPQAYAVSGGPWFNITGTFAGEFTNDIAWHVANATVADLMHNDANGQAIYAYVYNDATGTSGIVAGTAAPDPTPLPPAALLFVGGLALLGMLARKRRAA